MKGKDDSKHAVRELVKYLQYLGHGDICLRCDQEPAILTIQALLQRTWQRKGFRVVIENAKVLDHGGNAWAEKAIDRVRGMAGVLLQQLSSNIGHEVPANHPLFSWSFQHAAWILDRFITKAGTTPYELIRGHAYRGKLCQYAEPVMGYVADTTKRKGDARWRPGVFLGKSLTNDMFILHCDGNVRLTRSVKSIYKDWSEHMELYRTIMVQPWHIEGTIGNRIDPAGSQYVGEALPLDDEAGDDPPEEAHEEVVVSVPPLRGPPSASTPFDAELPENAADEGDGQEPSAKGQKLSLRRVGGEELCHMDVESWEYIDSHVDEDISNNWVDFDIPSDVDFDEDLACENGSPAQGVSVWRPISDMQPELPADELGLIDVEADKIEVQRLLAMNVIATRWIFWPVRCPTFC